MNRRTFIKAAMGTAVSCVLPQFPTGSSALDTLAQSGIKGAQVGEAVLHNIQTFSFTLDQIDIKNLTLALNGEEYTRSFDFE